MLDFRAPWVVLRDLDIGSAKNSSSSSSWILLALGTSSSSDSMIALRLVARRDGLDAAADISRSEAVAICGVIKAKRGA